MNKNIARPLRALASTVLLAAFCSLLVFSVAEAGDAFRTEKADFSVRFQDSETSLRVLGVYVMPGETVELHAFDEGAGLDYLLVARCGEIVEREPNSWLWKAPDTPGLYPISVERASWACGGEPASIVLNVFVLVPYDEMDGGSLRGYRIGYYPTPSQDDYPAYARPEGFVEVTEENMSTRVSPHFTLCQFLCKQEGQFPKYVVLDERLLLKLECALERVNELGIRCDSFHVMSGYRTPGYNRALGNGKYSRHLWGAAADIFVDMSPRDGNMDDLNGDGVVDLEDAAVLYRVIDEMCSEPEHQDLVGGLARYRENHAHGPFVHLDVRGHRVRWGS
jgi:hypothetical protein